MAILQQEEALQLNTAEVRTFRMMAREGKPMTEIAEALGKPYMRLSRWAKKHGYKVLDVRTVVEWEMPEINATVRPE